ncbi:MAG TPA: sulfatase-like hydrolase/transferase [Candidatus Hydrogenedentes bacterium]|nr:sulfatase-like hydrolase/transferase [Candidatus Hydrogenedentota bacterium]HQE84639.1 sulfatase-like hydrolase/transferase [Candidatus Hydrogenedentota bacterium]HQH52324.1 sulfatase-like hydrolase/transferase [Candidatus Hydrogenedentota bacterium]HQM47426.1 sulfatase-like hydrolase/transferase [Candidatus Hydrogenedentota bacterium]
MKHDIRKHVESRRAFIQSVGLAAAAAGCVGARRVEAQTAAVHEGTAETGGQPNILFIFTDQQRWDTVSAYGDNMGRALDLSPNLDAMAAEGVLFENAFSCQPVCGPTRACLQTGLFATETGCWRNGIALPLDAVTLPRLLRPAGYEAGYIGKWHLASTPPKTVHHDKPVPPEYRGGYEDYWLASDVLEYTSHSYDGHMFDRDGKSVEFPKNRYRVDAVTDFAVDYLRSRKRDKPFFLFLSYIEPHHQNDHKHFEGPAGSKEKYREYPVPGDLEGVDGDWKEELPDYLGCCGSLDGAVGRLRGELQALGVAGNTLVIYTSDHACHFRTRNSEYKRSCHESSIHVPMIMCGPGFMGGKRVRELVSLIDVPPTVVTAGGAEPPAQMQGHALQPLVAGTARDWQDDVFVQISESQTGRAIRTNRWKYAVRAPGKYDNQTGGSSDLYAEDFLYDLEADSHECTNLVREPAFAGVREEMKGRLLKRMAQAHEKTPEIAPAPIAR